MDLKYQKIKMTTMSLPSSESHLDLRRQINKQKVRERKKGNDGGRDSLCH